MNYSESTATYGRKMVTGSAKVKRIKTRRLFTTMIIILVIGIGIGFLLGRLTEKNPYGQISEMVMSEKMTSSWENGMTFTPLNVDMDYKTQEFVFFLSKAYNLDFPFVMAVIDQESSFDETTVSKTNDFGLMQINKINHKWMKDKLGVTDILDPYQNINAGMYVLKQLFEKHEDPAKVLMAYNMGETGAKKLWNKGITSSKYSKEVMEKAVAYSIQIKEGSVSK